MDIKLDKILTKLTDEERGVIYSLISRDPLTNLYNRAVVTYMLMLFVALLWPFDFVFQREKNNVHWITKSNGIEFRQRGQVLSRSSTENLCSRLLIGTGFSLEVWIASKNEVQSGPARIVSYSLNPSLRNFTLGQSKNDLVMRLRTTKTDLNGVKPYLKVANVFGSAGLQHIIVTYDFLEQRVYINGTMQAREQIPGGKFTNWDPSYYLMLGNEATCDRPWLGKIFFLAIYSRPLAEKEIHQNYLAGWLSESRSGEQMCRASEGLVARYLFEERRGDRIGDSGKTKAPLNLYIPPAIQTQKKSYLDFSYRLFSKNSKQALFGDVILNIIIFIPMGFLLHAVLRRHCESSLKTAAFVFIIGTLFTFGIESLQYFSLTRSSSLVDMINNMVGTAIGIATDIFYIGYLKSQRKSLQI
ncbi:MAG: VanZ family protein [Deltaproteobacteria bacterium]|nr:VanZ family protein [Deltaproteobacteria bacterium]